MSKHCPCGAELESPAAQAIGLCDTHRKGTRRPVPRRKSAPAPTEPMFDAEPQQRRLVPLPHWPDYHAQGVKT